MKLSLSLTLITCLLTHSSVPAQDAADFIYSKEGKRIMLKRSLVSNCLLSLHTDRSNAAALSVCECQVKKLNHAFSNSQVTNHTSDNIIRLDELIDLDSSLKASIKDCYGGYANTLSIISGVDDDFISSCEKNIRKNSSLTPDSLKLLQFCTCQFEVFKNRKPSDKEFDDLDNPNSLLYFEMIYKCGDPFALGTSTDNNWNAEKTKDINGPEIDTIKVLNMRGMTFVKIKTGSMVQFWLFDTGATDMLINKEMESTLRKEGIINDSAYLGTGEYEMANGIVDTCRKYRIDNIRIGKFSINNVVVAVSDKNKRIIAGRSLFNKFSNWLINNKNSTLIIGK